MQPLRVAVLSCGALGAEVAARLVECPEVRDVVLVTAPYRTRVRSFRGKLRHVWRTQGPAGLAGVAAAKLRRALGAPDAVAEEPPLEPPPGVEHLRVPDFHDPGAIAALRARAPDLGVLAGTYILRPEVFEIPRLGSINLHSGKVPEYRGAAPAFWELYHGEHAVGITIHRVVAALDAGTVLRQEMFPLDPAPPDDPIAYIERYRREVLRPNGVRLLAEVVSAIARGTATETQQDAGRARTHRTPDYRAIRELRRRVAARRRGAHAA
ncbi:MAG TPA: formyltransferase family protein [Gemmatimonadaceae bacterium]